jgi:hypothetical protein
MYSRRIAKRLPISPSAQFAAEMPILVIQEMKPEFVQSPDCGKTNFKYQGGLHPLHSDSISRVHLVHPCRRQLYAIKNLNGHPHYSISPDDLSLFREHCSLILDGGVSSLVEYSPNESYDDNDFLKVWNEGTPEFSEFSELFDALKLRESLLGILFSSAKNGKVDVSRNNCQISHGFSGLNQKKCSKDGVHEAMPQMNKGTMEVAPYLVAMSDLARFLKLDFVRILNRKSEQLHLDMFARTIDLENLFPGCTIGFYRDLHQLLTIHTDNYNCAREGHNVQMVASETFAGIDDTKQRVFFAAYGRSCCQQYLDRDKQSDEVVMLLTEMKLSLPACRHRISPLTRKSPGICIHGSSVIRRPVCMDKHSLISFILECITIFEASLAQPLGLSRLLELCLVVAWVSSHDQLYDILVKKWSNGRPPIGNLCIAYAKEMFDFGGCNGGECRRFQPHFNKDISQGQLYRSLACLLSIVQQVNASFLDSEVQIIQAYTNAVKDCKEFVIGAGGLTAQHLIHSLVFTGALQVPPFFATVALMGTQTKSYKELKKRYPSMTSVRATQLLRTVSTKMETEMRVVEEMLCCLSKNPTKRDNSVEPALANQTYVFATNTEYMQLLPHNEVTTTLSIPVRGVVIFPCQAPSEFPWWKLPSKFSHTITSHRDRLSLLTKKFDRKVIRVWASPKERSQLPSVQKRKRNSVTPQVKKAVVRRKTPRPVPNGLMSEPSSSQYSIWYKKLYKFNCTIWSPCRIADSDIAKALAKSAPQPKIPKSAPKPKIPDKVTTIETGSLIRDLDISISNPKPAKTNNRSILSALNISTDNQQILHFLPCLSFDCLPSEVDLMDSCHSDECDRVLSISLHCIVSHVLANSPLLNNLRQSNKPRRIDNNSLRLRTCIHRVKIHDANGKKHQLLFSSLNDNSQWRDKFGANYRSPLTLMYGGGGSTTEHLALFPNAQLADSHFYLSVILDLSPVMFHNWLVDNQYVILRRPCVTNHFTIICVIFRYNNEVFIGHPDDNFASRYKVPNI